jgi:hypothetical protein
MRREGFARELVLRRAIVHPWSPDVDRPCSEIDRSFVVQLPIARHHHVTAFIPQMPELPDMFLDSQFEGF